MPDKHDVEKLKLIDAVQATLSQKDPALAEFARAFYDRGAAEDLVTYTAEELIGFVTRTPGRISRTTISAPTGSAFRTRPSSPRARRSRD